MRRRINSKSWKERKTYGEKCNSKINGNEVDVEKNDKENLEQSAEELHKEQEEKKPSEEQSAEQPQDKQGKNAKNQGKTIVHDSLDRNKSKLEQEQKPQNHGDKQKKHEERAER